MYPHFTAPGEVYQEYARRVAAVDHKYQRALAQQGNDPQFAAEPRPGVWQLVRVWVTAAIRQRPAEEGIRA